MYNTNYYIEQVEEYVVGLLCELPDDLCYHNLKHTEEVVEASKILAKESKLSSVDEEIVIIAAWFHDVGHIETYFGHEKVGMEIAKKFLTKIKYPKNRLAKVLNCIMATQYPPKPKNELQKVLCDADMFHLSFEDYENRSKALKEEIETVIDKEIPSNDWHIQNVEFLQEHCYFTSYGKKILNFLKEKNLKQYFNNHCCQNRAKGRK